MKVVVCAVGKNENNYIREWIEWHKNIGVSKIFLYDNNDIDGEQFEDVINDYIESGFVELDKSWRGSYNMQRQMLIYLQCYKTKCNDYDWCAFIDIDEFINTEGNNICDILSNERYEEFNAVRLFYRMFTDNGLIRIGDTYNVHKRFTEYFSHENGKSIIRCNLPQVKYINCHGSGNAIPSCDATGVYTPFLYDDGAYIDEVPIYEVMWVDHYRYKSLEEYVGKMNRGYPFGIKGRNPNFLSLNDFFTYNKKTPEKLKYLKSIGIDYE